MGLAGREEKRVGFGAGRVGGGERRVVPRGGNGEEEDEGKEGGG